MLFAKKEQNICVCQKKVVTLRAFFEIPELN